MGGVELLIILAIILLFFGAKRVPELARSLGRGKREFHRGVEEDEAQQQLDKAVARERGDKEEGAAPRERARPEGAAEAGGAGTQHNEGGRAERSPY